VSDALRPSNAPNPRIGLKRGDSVLDDKKCVQILRRLRWPGSTKCPSCNSFEVIKSGKHQEFYQRYRCKSCGRIFNDKTGTIFEGSKESLGLWFLAAALLRNGKTIMEISRRLGVSYETAFRMVKKLKKEENWKRINEMIDA
jgi:transposase-like protein